MTKADNKPLFEIATASEVLAKLRGSDEGTQAYLDECITVVDKLESDVRAFASLDRNLIASGSHSGLLAGIPIGVKDVIETAELPTEFNSPLYKNHNAARDAACLTVLRAEGALVLGKTTTVEFASLGRLTTTRNPHNYAHTPGGSSSGSAAAVAAGMVPIALGTQTGGSTIRPASFCGVAALKPTWGLVPAEGLKPYAPSLDTISWMARSVADLERVLHCFRPVELEPELPDTPRIGFYRTPYWDNAQAETKAALRRCIDILEADGVVVENVVGPDGDELLKHTQDTIMHAEGRVSYLAEYLAQHDLLHQAFCDEVENSREISAADLAAAYDYFGHMRPAMEQLMSGFDAWLTPAVPGEAPFGLESTGDAVFNRLWTALHMPCVTLPGFSGPKGLPVGIQLVAPRFKDRRLLATASRVEALISAA